MKILSLLIVYFITTTSVWSYPWPIRNFQEPHQINATLGDYRQGITSNPLYPRFHNGVDIQASQGTEVYSIESGYAIPINSGIRVGDYAYIHLTAMVQESTYVLGILDTTTTPPDTIGVTNSENHVHFMEGPAGGPYQNPLRDGGLGNYTDNNDPTIIATPQFFPQGEELTTNRDPLHPDALYGKVDIRVHMRDSANTGQGTGIYECSYVVEDTLHNPVHDPGITTVFDQVSPPPNSTPVVYVYDTTETDHANSATFHYWATNPIVNNQVEDWYWNTKQKIGEPDSVDAQNKDEAKFADGEYWVKVIAYDIRNNSDPESIRVKVDNFPPRVGWVYPPNGAIDVPIETQVRIGFDEPMDQTVNLQTAITFSPGVSGNWVWDTDTSAVFTPDPAFEPGHQYTVKAVADLLHDLAEKTLDGNEDGTSQGSPIDDYSWSFSTWMDYWLTEVPYNWDDAYWPVETWTNEIWCHFELMAYRFYGRYIYDHIPISGTGSIWWSDGCDISYHYDLPSANGHQYGVIAPYNDSIYVDFPWRIGNLYIEYKTDRRVIEWEFLRKYVTEFRDTTNFEVVLFNNGNIRFDYKRIEIFHNDGGSGISAGDTLRWISLTDAVGPVYTLEGRSFLFSVSVPPGAPVDLHLFEPEKESLSIGLAWSQNPEPDLSGYNVYRKESEATQFERVNGNLVTDTTYTDTVEHGVVYSYAVTALDTFLCESQFSNIVSWPPQFIRGDATSPTTPGYGDGWIAMSDAVYILKVLYVPGTPPPHCWDALDVNDDGEVTMSDAIYLLQHLYVPGSPPPPPPFGEHGVFPDDCGPDPTSDDLDCQDHPCQHFSEASSSEPQVDGEIIFGDAFIQDENIMVPVYLQNNRPLSAFSYTISYDPTVLTFRSAENTSLTTQSFDFFSARPEEELGLVSVGALVDMGLKKNLTSGYHEVTHLIFELKTNESQETVLKFTDVELVDTEARSLSAHTNTCTIRMPFSIPKVFGLGQNYPNPVKDWTAIRYQLPKSTHTTLRIYNAAGQLLRTLVDEAKNPGYYSEIWNGKDNLGRKVSSGVYFYQLKTDEYTKARKLVVVQ